MPVGGTPGQYPARYSHPTAIHNPVKTDNFCNLLQAQDVTRASYLSTRNPEMAFFLINSHPLAVLRRCRDRKICLHVANICNPFFGPTDGRRAQTSIVVLLFHWPRETETQIGSWLESVTCSGVNSWGSISLFCYHHRQCLFAFSRQLQAQSRWEVHQ